MATFCIPKRYTKLFSNLLADGTIDPVALSNASSASRHKLFAEHFGEDLAKELNASFESKLLLKNQQAGMIDWLNAQQGLKPEVKRDIVDQIQKLDRILQPADKDSYLADLIDKKLGLSVPFEDAQKLVDASLKVKSLEPGMAGTPGNSPERRAWGLAKIDLIDTMNGMKPGGMTWKEGIVQVVNAPKQILTGEIHATAPIQQNWGLMTTRYWWKGISPITWGSGRGLQVQVPKMIQYFSDEQNYKNLMADIISHPDYAKMVDGELGLTQLGDKFSAREEENSSRIMEAANEYLKQKSGGYVPNLFRASARGFTGYSNFVRAGRFVDLLKAAELAGEDVNIGSKVLKDLAETVNDFSGRGKIPGGLSSGNSLSAALNLAFFAPRKLAGTIQMFNPIKTLGGWHIGDARFISRTAHYARVRQLSGSLLATGTILSLAASFGYKVDVNPISQDAFQVVTPNGEKFDLTGGNALYLRLLSRLAMNSEITSKGKEVDFDDGYKPETRASAFGNFLRNKLSPFVGFVTDAMYGADPIGREFSLDQEARDKLIPIVAGQFIDYYVNNPHDAVDVLPSLFSFAGIAMRSPLPPRSKNGITAWGERANDPLFDMLTPNEHTPLDDETERLGWTPQPPPDKVNGEKLSDQEYQTYAALSGQQAKSMMEPLIKAPGWDQMTDTYKLNILKSMFQTARTLAQIKLFGDTASNPNGLLQKIFKTELEKLQPLQKVSPGIDLGELEKKVIGE